MMKVKFRLTYRRGSFMGNAKETLADIVEMLWNRVFGVAITICYLTYAFRTVAVNKAAPSNVYMWAWCLGILVWCAIDLRITIEKEVETE